MKLSEALEDLGVRPQDIQVMTLATDGYSAAKHRLLMVCMAGWAPRAADARPEYQMVAGGDVDSTAAITCILPTAYKLQAQAPEEVKKWFLGRVTPTTILVGHCVCRFSRPFLEQLLGEPSEKYVGGYLDTQVIGRAAIGGRLADGLDKCTNLALLQAKLSAMSMPGNPPKSLEGMCEYYGLPVDYTGWPMAPWQKAYRTMALLNRLLAVDLPT